MRFLNNSKNFSREYYKDDMHHEMAIFYYFYGDAVLYKVKYAKFYDNLFE